MGLTKKSKPVGRDPEYLMFKKRIDMEAKEAAEKFAKENGLETIEDHKKYIMTKLAQSKFFGKNLREILIEEKQMPAELDEMKSRAQEIMDKLI